jgi:acyl carrier protein
VTNTEVSSSVKVLMVVQDQHQAGRAGRAGRAALRVAAALAGLPGDPDGYRFPHPRASVTNGERAGAAAVLVSGPAAGIGVDLEHDRPVTPAMARFYLHDDELSTVVRPGYGPGDDPLRLWTVKEAIFKADPGNAGRIVRDYRVTDPAYQHKSVRYRGGWLTVAAQIRRVSVPSAVITFDAVADRIAEVLRVPASSLTPQTTLKDLAADSFMLVEMIVDLQEEFDAIFKQAQLREVTCLGDLVRLLQDTAA